MSIFQRQRVFTPGGGLPTIPFFVPPQAVEKFNLRNERFAWSWAGVEKSLAYKPITAIFFRKKSNDPSEILFEAFCPVPRAEQTLRILFRLDRNGIRFFVIDMSLQLPTQHDLSLAVERELLIDFHPELSFGTSDQFHELLEELWQLKAPTNRKRPEVQAEIRTWAKYLTAMDKITKDKTILFKVTQKDRRTQRKRGVFIDYELDPSFYAAELKTQLQEILGELPIAEIEIGKEHGHIDLIGAPTIDPELVEQLQSALSFYFYQWQTPPTQPKRVLSFELQPKYQSSQAQNKRLMELDGKLRESGTKFKRNQLQFQLDEWQDWASWATAIAQDAQIWLAPPAPTVRLQLDYALDDPQRRSQALSGLASSLQAILPLRSTAVAGDTALAITLQADKNLDLSHAGSQWEIASVQFSGTAIPKVEPEATPAKLKAKAGAQIDGNDFSLQGDSRIGLKDRYSILKRENPEFEFPDWNTRDLHYEIGFAHLLHPEQWKADIRKGILAIHGLRFKDKEVVAQPQTAQELTAICKQIGLLFKGLESKVKAIEVSLQFQQSDPKVCKQLVEESMKRLRRAYEGNVEFEDNKTKAGGTLGTLTLVNIDTWQPIHAAMVTVCGAEMTLTFPQTEGCTRLELVFGAKMLEAFLEEKWKVLRGCNLKFLTAQETVEYEKEIAGKGGHYNGGRELGRLHSLRNGQLTVQLKEEAVELSLPTSGYILPTFIGDLAQIARLREAISLVQHRKNGLPINPNLCNFIFDAKAAKEISMGHDVRSDRHWQLKHKLNEAALNTRQKEAVWKVLQAEDLVLVQGPPGTGKTTVIAEIVWQMLQENPNQKILISSQSHLAVDNALERLYKKNLIRPLRIAARTGNAIEPEGRLYFQEVIEDWAKASVDSKEERENKKNAVVAWLDRVVETIETQEQFDAIQAKWRKQIQAPNPDIKEMMKDIYLQNVNVVAATCLECGQKDFKNRYAGEGFDCVIVDEASKATPPEMLVPLVLAKKVVIIGDHKQLPPMIEERKIEEVLREIGEEELADDMEALKTLQFEKLFLDASDSVKVTLNTQYRMHDHIMQVINAFYQDEGGLQCGIKEEMDKPDFSLRGSRWHGLSAHPLIGPDDHVIWVEVNSPEIAHNPSFSNDGEVEAVRKVLAYLQKADGYAEYLKACKKEEDQEIGLVSFYGKQVQKLQDLVQDFQEQGLKMRLRTVDKFQGMERNIMIVSTVRSDTQITAKGDGDAGNGAHPAKPPRKNSDIGFAKDFRRVNVAFSRARRLLIIVGNESHFAKHNALYKDIKAIIGRYGSRIDVTQL